MPSPDNRKRISKEDLMKSAKAGSQPGAGNVIDPEDILAAHAEIGGPKSPAAKPVVADYEISPEDIEKALREKLEP